MPRVDKHATARGDLIEHYVYLVEEAGEWVANRFLDYAGGQLQSSGHTAQDGRAADTALPSTRRHAQVARR